MNHPASKSHSAKVRLSLRVGEHLLNVAQVARDFLILRESVACPLTEGTLIVCIDEQVTETAVIPPDGLTENSERVAYW